MRLRTLRIQNFRSCSDLAVAFDDYTCLVGPNGAGKSTILAALNVIFRNVASAATPVVYLLDEDFCDRDTSKPIVLTATFGELTAPEQADFKAYYRNGQLVVAARADWNPETNRAEVKQYGARLVMRAFAPWFEALASDAKAPVLKEVFKVLRDEHPELASAASKADMEASLRAYEEANRERCELIESEDQFYGWSRGENRLRKYFQWVYVPAVKEASSEQAEGKATALGELLQRTIRAAVDFDEPLGKIRADAQLKYKAILEERQGALRAVSEALEGRLQAWSHPDARLALEWHFEADKAVVVQGPTAKASVGEGGFVGEIARLGHGLQRAFILTLLQELAGHDASDAPTLLLGFEEPELFQHPPQARHLADVLEALTGANAQVIVATHSPYFVRGAGFERARYFRKNRASGHSCCTHVSMARLSVLLAEALGTQPEAPTDLMAQIEQILQPTQRELVFCNLPLLVEGLEDVAFIGTHMRLSGRWVDFRRIGAHFIMAEGKTNLSRPLAIAKELALPFFVVFDGDGPHTDAEKTARNRRDNLCLLKLSDLAYADPLSASTIVAPHLRMWATSIGEVVRLELGPAEWDTAEASARTKYGRL